MKNLPELRFKGFNKQWSTAYLNDVATRVTRKNKNLESHIPLTISAEKGLVDQLDYYNNRVASKDISGYYLIQNGEFAYNKSTSRDAPYGAIKRLDFYKNGVLSTLYIVFRITNGDLDSFKYYFESIYWHREIYKISQEGARNHGLLNISVNDFFDIKIKIPNLEEQEKIGNLFKKIDALIEIQESKVSKMEDLKKSMLQKMFPKKDELVPELRFDGFDGEWKKLTLGDIGEVQSSGVNKIIYNNQRIVRLLNYMDVYNKKNPTNSNIDTFMKTSASDKEMLSKDVTKGDIFFTPTSETAEDIGHSMVVEDNVKEMVYSYHIFRFRPNSDVLDINFSDYFCNVDPVRKQLKIKAQGAQRYTLKLNDFRELIIKIPPLAEQQKIGKFFKNLDAQIENEEKLLESYKMMKKSLLQKMFV